MLSNNQVQMNCPLCLNNAQSCIKNSFSAVLASKLEQTVKKVHVDSYDEPQRCVAKRNNLI